MAKAASAPTDRHGRADEHRGVHPVAERLRRLVAADVCEDRGEHGHAEDAAQLADRVVGPRLAFTASAESTTFATGAKKSAMPTPATMNGAMSDEYGTVGVETDPSASATACIARPVPMISFGGCGRRARP